MKGRLFILAFASMTIMLGIVTNAWSQLPQSRLKNAGFESGNLLGWKTSHAPYNQSGQANVVTSHTNMFGDVTYSPKFGGYFAELKTGVETKISQSVFLRGGQKLAGWAAFDAQVDLPSSSHAKVTVYNQAKTIFKVIWESNVADVGRFGTSPWTRWEWVAPVRGSYTLEYTVGSFSGGNSYGLFDSFELFKREMNLNR